MQILKNIPQGYTAKSKTQLGPRLNKTRNGGNILGVGKKKKPEIQHEGKINSTLSNIDFHVGGDPGHDSRADKLGQLLIMS